MSIKKIDKGYKLDFRPNGYDGKRIIRRCKSLKEAKLLQAEIQLLFQKSPSAFDKDKRKLSDLVRLWYELHGQTLKDAKYRYSRTLALCKNLNDPTVHKFTAQDFAIYRSKSLKSGKSKSTLNHELRYLRAVFSELHRLDYFDGSNPLSKVKAYKLPQSSLSFLDIDQIQILLDSCKQSTNSHLYPVVLLCLATGARFGEANSLKRQYLLKDRVIFDDTKNGKSRVVRIQSSLSRYLRLKAYPANFSNMFASCKSAFRSAVKRAELELPQGQLTHILRHTFASHFVMNGGSLKVLQEVLGHEDIKTTMIYAHLAPDYLESVLTIGIYPEWRKKTDLF